MAIKYKKPMILSRIPSFVNYINEFESFGHTFSLLKQDELEELLSKIIEETFQYYTIFDLNKYNNNESFERFKSEFKIAFLT